jgi:hypothetical protein
VSAQRGVLALVGATATGKSALAVEVALRLGGEIISADAFTAYRGIDAGTAKPTVAERRGVPHHLIDIKEPDEPFSAGEFARSRGPRRSRSSREETSRSFAAVRASTFERSSMASSSAPLGTSASVRLSGSSRRGTGLRGSSGRSASSTPKAGHGSRRGTERVPFDTSRSPSPPAGVLRTSFERGQESVGKARR